MIEFKPVRLEDKQIIERHTMPSGILNCDLAFANMYCWQAMYHSAWAVIDGFLVIPEPRSLRAQLLLFHLYFFSFDVQIAVQRFGTFLDIFQLFNGNHILSSNSIFSNRKDSAKV